MPAVVKRVQRAPPSLHRPTTGHLAKWAQGQSPAQGQAGTLLQNLPALSQLSAGLAPWSSPGHLLLPPTTLHRPSTGPSLGKTTTGAALWSKVLYSTETGEGCFPKPNCQRIPSVLVKRAKTHPAADQAVSGHPSPTLGPRALESLLSEGDKAGGGHRASMCPSVNTHMAAFVMGVCYGQAGQSLIPSAGIHGLTNMKCTSLCPVPSGG